MTDKQTDRQACRQTDRQAGTQTDRQTDMQTDMQTGRQAGRQASKDREGQAVGGTGRRMYQASSIEQSCRHKHNRHMTMQEAGAHLQLFHSVTTCHLGDVGGIIRQAPLPTVLDEALQTTYHH